ncbi:superoxide dismutase family protein [Paenibacillus solanacearum]|uniref:superoxide dismutase family protein n=1 Tax=Paenibacillus solanacearum TaxID=2048548 RepID=UPI003CCE6AB3
MPRGEHGFPVHENDKCEAPQFESAGAHFNPYNDSAKALLAAVQCCSMRWVRSRHAAAIRDHNASYIVLVPEYRRPRGGSVGKRRTRGSAGLNLA